MPAQIFADRPHVELLQWLARGSLKQNLPRAIRLWAWLHALYGKNSLPLREPFSYSDWRDSFFSPSHTKGEEVPNLHDPDCACARTTADWIFNPQTGVTQSDWRRLLFTHDGIPDSTLDELLQRRLFAVTRRSLYADLQILSQLGWVERQGQQYQRVHDFPVRPISGLR